MKLEIHGSKATSDAGPLAYRELDEAPGLTALVGEAMAESRTGTNGWHGLVGLHRQAVYGRLVGYEGMHDTDRLGRGSAMRWIGGGTAIERGAVSASRMGRFETAFLASDRNLSVLNKHSGV